jgi:hypothetical protein
MENVKILQMINLLLAAKQLKASFVLLTNKARNQTKQL